MSAGQGTLSYTGSLSSLRRALYNFSAEDNVGSPYYVRRCIVDEPLGGPQGLVAARSMLRKCGLRLILDLVPNHVVPDHPWVVDHDLVTFYGRLLKETDRDVFRNGEWRLCGRSGWPDNQSHLNQVAWCWRKDDNRFLRFKRG